MTLEKAIKTLTEHLEILRANDMPETHQATRLAIEALETWKLVRSGAWPNTGYLLPSETEE